MKKIQLLLLYLLVVSASVCAGTMSSARSCVSNTGPWSVTASLGYSVYQDMYSEDGQSAMGRLAIGRAVYENKRLTLGMEVGVQNGKTMRLGVPQETLDELGSLPIQSTVNPMLDLLATIKTAPLGNSSINTQLKAGIAYRRWEFNDRTSINDLSQVAGEIQAGFGYAISSKSSLSLFYQGVFGNHPNFEVDALAQTGHVHSIPIQQGIFLSVTFVI